MTCCYSEGDQPWDFFGRNDAKAETPVLWPPHVKSWLIGKDSDAWRDWGQEEKGTTKDEMAGWHHRLDGRESEWTWGVGDGQGGLACCDSWGRKELDTTERLNWTELNWTELNPRTTRFAHVWTIESVQLDGVWHVLRAVHTSSNDFRAPPLRSPTPTSGQSLLPGNPSPMAATERLSVSLICLCWVVDANGVT